MMSNERSYLNKPAAESHYGQNILHIRNLNLQRNKVSSSHFASNIK